MGDIKKVLVHSCLKREEGFDEDNPLPPNCRCRRWASMAEAKQLVDDGEASFVAAFRRVIDVEVECNICGRDPKFSKTCLACNGAGIITGKKPIVIRGEDIVFVSRLKKTPRTATIEKAHIERSTEKHKDEAIRSDFYEILTVEFYASLGATIRDSKTKNPVIMNDARGNPVKNQGKLEPEDDPKLGQGRSHDWGRPV